MLSKEDLTNFMNQFPASFDSANKCEVWFTRPKDNAIESGFIAGAKEFKRTLGYAACVLRMQRTGIPTSPDLCTLTRVTVPDRMKRRLPMGAFK